MRRYCLICGAVFDEEDDDEITLQKINGHLDTCTKDQPYINDATVTEYDKGLSH